MSTPNDSRFTSSNKEKVALLINRKQGENYHMRPVKTRHTGFSVIVTTAVHARSLHIEGLLSDAQRPPRPLYSSSIGNVYIEFLSSTCAAPILFIHTLQISWVLLFL